MFLIIWQYKVRPDKEALFVQNYNSHGRWAQFFRTVFGYRDTTLVKDIHEYLAYVTIDYWHSEKHHRRFFRNRAEEYAALDRECQLLTESEQKLGESSTT